jgi:hypothetical protein
MRRKHKALPLLALLLFFCTAVSACSGQVAHESDVYTEATNEPGEGEEEVLASDSDEFGRTDYSTPDGKAAGFFVSTGYIAMIIGSAILPLLFL